MNHDPRPHIHRRRHAIGRLRSLTTGAAVAGLAGTAGFGVLAAASWSGTPGAVAAGADTTTDGPAGGTTLSPGSNGTSGTSGTTGTNRTRVAPTTGGTIQGTTPRIQRSTGTGHASSGGSH